MISTHQCLHVELFIVLRKVVLTFAGVRGGIPKATEWYFPVVLFIMLY